MSHEKYATEEIPIRPSKTDRIKNCRVFGVLSMFDPDDDLGGDAAQTGTVVHKGVAAFHLEPDQNRKVQAALDAIESCLPEFPQADPSEIRLFMTPYMADERNIYAKFAVDMQGKQAIEYPITCRLEPHHLDPTGQKIVIKGTLDQIRWDDRQNGYVDWDLKTGKPTGFEMIHRYMLQQASYSIGANQAGFNVVGAGIIRAHDYRKRGGPGEVFWSIPLSMRGLTAMLDALRLQVALIRMGEIDFGPGFECGYCQYGGVQGCLPQIEEKYRISLA